MKFGHVKGTKRDAKPRQATVDRLKAMGEAIAKAQAGLSVEALLNTPVKVSK